VPVQHSRAMGLRKSGRHYEGLLGNRDQGDASRRAAGRHSQPAIAAAGAIGLVGIVIRAVQARGVRLDVDARLRHPLQEEHDQNEHVEQIAQHGDSTGTIARHPGLLAYSEPGMWRRSRSGRLLLWTIVLAVLTVRASDTHLHLCFDGQEPPTSVHFADASIHNDDDHDDENHADKDLDPLVGVLLKSGDADPELALPVSVVALVLLLPLQRDVLPIDFDPVPLAAGPPSHLRPPLRGPPV